MKMKKKSLSVTSEQNFRLKHVKDLKGSVVRSIVDKLIRDGFSSVFLKMMTRSEFKIRAIETFPVVI